MKNTHLFGSIAFTTIIALSPMQAIAQATSDTTTPMTTTSPAAPRDHDDDGPDLGWIGLLGLLGLAGLLRKRHDDHAHVTTTTRNP